MNEKNLKNCRSNDSIFTAAESDRIAGGLCGGYADRIGVNLLEECNLPGRREVLDILDGLLELLFPGFAGEPARRDELKTQTATLLSRLQGRLFDQISRALRCICTRTECAGCEAFERSTAAVRALFFALPDIRETLKQDVAAAFAGDPAAGSYEEIVLSYPCIKAISIQRIAHELYKQKIPLIPRMMTEYAHTVTGIDIHPGASLGRGVFIDHGTGVVIGETAVIGNNVRIYQGVTLGALSFPKDACGMLVKGQKRHPTVCANVTIYAGATVLGDIVIGENCIIGGNVWLTESLPPGTKITARPPEHRMRPAPKE